MAKPGFLLFNAILSCPRKLWSNKGIWVHDQVFKINILVAFDPNLKTTVSNKH